MVNPYLVSRFWYEVMCDRSGALELFNAALKKDYGIEPFHTVPKNVLAVGQYKRFNSAIAHLMYDGSPVGLSDCLNVRYGDLFSALWLMAPNKFWLIELILKDFRKPDFKQLYLDRVDESEYGDMESPQVIASLFEREKAEGRFCFNHELEEIPLGVISFEATNVIESAISERWRGLKENMIEKMPEIPLPFEQISVKEFYAKTVESKPGWISNYFFEQLFDGVIPMEKGIALSKTRLIADRLFLAYVAEDLSRIQNVHPEIMNDLPFYLGRNDISDQALFWDHLMNFFSGKLSLEKLLNDKY